MEKLCLIGSGVGRDHISDFTTNLIKNFLLEYTQSFAKQHVDRSLLRPFRVDKTAFNYETESWESGHYTLPAYRGEYVILTPSDILTRDETWINRQDLISRFDEIVGALPNESLRAQVDNHLRRQLSKRAKQKEINQARANTIQQFPALIEYYIKDKEDHGGHAASVSSKRVAESEHFYIDQVRPLITSLNSVGFYSVAGATYEEAQARVAYLKDNIEHKGGHRLFYVAGAPVRKEEDVQRLFRLVWFGTPSDVTAEANDGRGPVDFKISRGASDKTLVEFKLASNSQLKRNLEHQAEIYQKASDAKRAIKVIIYFSAAECQKVIRMLKTLRLVATPDVVLIDARKDNKPSGSKA
jgi:hypothetical protein